MLISTPKLQPSGSQTCKPTRAVRVVRELRTFAHDGGAGEILAVLVRPGRLRRELAISCQHRPEHRSDILRNENTHRGSTLETLFLACSLLCWRSLEPKSVPLAISSALPANLCPLSGCHECEGFNVRFCSGERHSSGKLAQSKYHRKMNSAELGARSSLI